MPKDENLHVKIFSGHTANLRKVITDAGLTHDWEIHVKIGKGTKRIDGIIKSAEFKLHETFPNPVQVVKKPDKDGAFRIRESGYASFLVDISITFKNGAVANIMHDLTLHTTSDISNYVEHDLNFANPEGDFRQALLQAGAEVKPRSPPKSPPLLPSATKRSDKEPREKK